MIENEIIITETFNKEIDVKSGGVRYFIKYYSNVVVFKLHCKSLCNIEENCTQGKKARKINCCCVFSAYILKPVLSGRCL